MELNSALGLIVECHLKAELAWMGRGACPLSRQLPSS